MGALMATLKKSSGQKMNIFQLIPCPGAGYVQDAAERTETREEKCSLEDDFQEHPEKKEYPALLSS